MKKLMFLLFILLGFFKWFQCADIPEDERIILQATRKKLPLAAGEKIGFVDLGWGSLVACRYSGTLKEYVWYGEDFDNVRYATIKKLYDNGQTQVKFPNGDKSWLALSLLSSFVGQ